MKYPLKYLLFALFANGLFYCVFAWMLHNPKWIIDLLIDGGAVFWFFSVILFIGLQFKIIEVYLHEFERNGKD